MIPILVILGVIGGLALAAGILIGAWVIHGILTVARDEINEPIDDLDDDQTIERSTN